MGKYKCGDCFHAEICEKSKMLDDFSRDNPAYCGMFINSADVAAVVHGKWLRSDDDWYCITVIQCSICGEEWCFEEIEDVTCLSFKHCPNCGAKMDGHTEGRT